MLTQPSQARAPGKVIVLGEHAVVYGQPAIALPIDRYVTVRCVPAARFELVTRPSAGGDALAVALDELAAALGNPSVAVHIESELPLSAGLGSSAAVAVAGARALAAAVGRTLTHDQVLELALHMEQTFHGKPSGIDHTTCALEALIAFSRGTPDQVQRLTGPGFSWVVAYAGARAGSTREKVLGLRASWARDPSHLEPVFERIGALSRLGVTALAHGDLAALGALMDQNHALLRDPLGLSTARIEAIVDAMKRHGALGAKLTGAGGGGAVIALHPDPHALAAALGRDHIEAFVATWKGHP